MLVDTAGVRTIVQLKLCQQFMAIAMEADTWPLFRAGLLLLLLSSLLLL
jgi:hypothetical protein